MQSFKFIALLLVFLAYANVGEGRKHHAKKRHHLAMRSACPDGKISEDCFCYNHSDEEEGSQIGNICQGEQICDQASGECLDQSAQKLRFRRAAPRGKEYASSKAYVSPDMFGGKVISST